ncbi:MAG TPA: hypothetical protein VIS77_13190 [Burkholderiales bacterium]
MRGIAVAVLGMMLAAPAFGADLLPWHQVRQKIEAHWAGTYAREKVLSITEKGAPQFSSSKQVTTSTHIGSSWYSAWVTSTKTVEGSFARQVALVTVERANKSRARFEVAALYRGERDAWVFDRIAVGPVTELGAPGDPERPSDAAAAKLFSEAWGRKRDDFEVGAIKVLAPAKLGSSKARRWLNYRLEISATGTARAPAKYRGKSVTCKPADYSSVLRWDAEGKAWRVDESMVQNINEDRDCDLN